MAANQQRERLPNRRIGEMFELEVAGLRYTATVGRFSDGRVGEIFLSNHKSNSAADTNARDSAIVCSIAFQCGADSQSAFPRQSWPRQWTAWCCARSPRG
jgi:hypothetical protein